MKKSIKLLFQTVALCYLFILLLNSCKKDKTNSSGLFNSTKNYNHFQVLSSGDTSILPDVIYTITAVNDLVWNKQTFKLQGGTFMPSFFGNNSVDVYVDGQDVPGHHGSSSSYVAYYYLYYCPITDKVVIQSVYGQNEYWVSF